MPAFVNFSNIFPWETLSEAFSKSKSMVAKVVEARLSNISLKYIINWVMDKRLCWSRIVGGKYVFDYLIEFSKDKRL